MATNDPNNRKPVPTKLVLLDQVQKQEAGTKIRFLACVHEYRTESGTLILKDQFPATVDASMILVNVDNVLGTLNNTLLEIGSWVNIIGYVRNLPRATSNSKESTSVLAIRKARTEHRQRTIEATMMWSAGAIKLDDYRSAVRSYQSTSLQAGS